MKKTWKCKVGVHNWVKPYLHPLLKLKFDNADTVRDPEWYRECIVCCKAQYFNKWYESWTTIR